METGWRATFYTPKLPMGVDALIVPPGLFVAIFPNSYTIGFYAVLVLLFVFLAYKQIPTYTVLKLLRTYISGRKRTPVLHHKQSRMVDYCAPIRF